MAQPYLEVEGLELVETQFRRERSGWVLRLFIDRLAAAESLSREAEGEDVPAGSGVTLDDCVEVSREVGRLLEVEDVVPVAYTLEVSSPGLDRPLKKPADFVRFSGRLIRVKVAGPEGKRTIKGRLLGLNGDRIELEAEGRVESVPRDLAVRVQLEPEVKWPRS